MIGYANVAGALSCTLSLVSIIDNDRRTVEHMFSKKYVALMCFHVVFSLVTYCVVYPRNTLQHGMKEMVPHLFQLCFFHISYLYSMKLCCLSESDAVTWNIPQPLWCPVIRYAWKK